MDRNDAELYRDNLMKRLKRIEGQVKGIQKMIREDKDCTAILTQVAAVRSAMNKAGSMIVEKHTMQCLNNALSCEDKEKTMTELAKSMNSFLKFIG